MTLKYLGHACFLFTDSSGLRVVVDPYEPGGFGGALGYGPITDAADVVLVTHEHADHNFVRGVPGDPEVCRGSCTARGVEFRTVPVPHDEDGGRRRGEVNAFTFALDGLRLCHVGDLGNPLTAGQVEQIGPLDLLLLPVGGTYTLDAGQAWAVVQQLAPRVVVPMHYRTPKVTLPLAPLTAFLDGRTPVTRVGASSWDISPESLPAEQRVVVLEPAN
jgi:L-ascorbate metabolism protein UlaG (beta-lactamase superfamily)